MRSVPSKANSNAWWMVQGHLLEKDKDMRNVSWIAVCAALWLVIAFVDASAGIITHSWYLIGGGAVIALAGIGLVALSWREDR